MNNIKITLTESRFRQLCSSFGNGSEIYKNGKRILVWSLNKGIDNKFHLSYHLKFQDKNIQFNFWLDKISYINSNEKVTISFYNGNEISIDRLKNIHEINCMNTLKSVINDLFQQYKYIGGD